MRWREKMDKFVSEHNFLADTWLCAFRYTFCFEPRDMFCVKPCHLTQIYAKQTKSSLE